MKRIIYVLSVLSILILSYGCSDEAETLMREQDHAVAPVVANPHRIPLSDALAQADALLSRIAEDEVKTRVPRVIKSVKYTLNVSTRSESVGNPIDTALYIVNYADNQGFAILGADDRLQSVYAISDEGNFSYEDTVQNQGLAQWLNAVEDEIKYSSILPSDSLSLPVNPVTPPIFDDDKTVTILKKVAPKLGKYQRLWGQEGNFNAYCMDPYTFSPQKVGCTPVAVAMIMSYYKWPRYRGKYYIDWDYINRWDFNSPQGNCPDRLAWMLHEIGVALNAEYGPEIGGQTSVNSYYLMRNMPELGYEALGLPFHFGKADACPDKRVESGPLLVCGSDNGSKDEGHSWVIDGYLKTQTEASYFIQPIVREYYHCVWGWYGKCNGYYLTTSDWSFGNASASQFDKDDLSDKTKVTSLYLDVVFWCNFNKLEN